MDENLPIDEDLLIRYLDGTITGSEQTALESRLRSDAVLLERLERLQAAKLAIQYAGTARQVRSLHKEMMKEIKPPARKLVSMNRSLYFIMGAAASIILVFFALRFFNAPGTGADEIYQQAFVDYTVSADRGTSQSSAIVNLYKQNEFAGVILSKTKAKDQHDSLLVGISALKIKAGKTAIVWLSNIGPSSAYHHDAEYYLAMAYLKEHQYGEALKIMRNIQSNPSHLYHQQVTADLLKNLEALEN